MTSRTILVLLLALGAAPAGAVEELIFGGNGGQSWAENSIIFNALDEELAAGLGKLAPLEADTTENLLPRVKELGGNATTSVTAAAARSNQILNELIDEDFKTGWRVYSNPNGAELSLDMGAVFILNRLRMLRGVLNDDERSLRGYELEVNDGEAINFNGDEPIYTLIASDRSHGEPELDINFTPQPVRFLRLRSLGDRGFQMGDMEIFGAGVTPFAQYVSRVIDLGESANFGPVRISARVDEKAENLFSTKTGAIEDDSLFFRQTGIPGELEEVPRGDFDRSLDPSYSGIVLENDRDWSAWSPPYDLLAGQLNSPENRRYLQFRFNFISNGLLDKVEIDSLVFSYTVPAIADSVIGEITPGTADLGQTSAFTYHLRSTFSGTRRGFDSVSILTPFASTATGVEVDGQPVSFEQNFADRKLTVVFAQDRISRSGQEVKIHFETLMTVSGTEFRGEVGDSASDAFPQRILPGDADDEVDSDGLVVGGRIEDRLFTGVRFSSPAFTPNGDGVNDELVLDYILLKATDPVDVRVALYNLAGRLVHTAYAQQDLSGPNTVRWDGRDSQGQMVPPGLYVLRLVAETDAGETARLHTIAVAY
jgi:hypothetical protein